MQERGKSNNIKYIITIIILSVALVSLGFISLNMRSEIKEDENKIHSVLDETVARTLLSLDSKFNEDRLEVKHMLSNFNNSRNEARILCDNLENDYRYDMGIINNISTFYDRYSEYDLTNLYYYFSTTLEDIAANDDITREDLELLQSIYETWQECDWERLSQDVSSTGFNLTDGNYGIVECLKQINETIYK
ncbi:MAG TPA: hypothetical protein IAB13_04910 [Candidatus Avanaerovorax faecigallinarum]|nr:hypothetical protein [Candidatus Avanaerovorax faecigallinarum]